MERERERGERKREGWQRSIGLIVRQENPPEYITAMGSLEKRKIHFLQFREISFFFTFFLSLEGEWGRGRTKNAVNDARNIVSSDSFYGNKRKLRLVLGKHISSRKWSQYLKNWIGKPLGRKEKAFINLCNQLHRTCIKENANNLQSMMEWRDSGRE